LLSSKEIEICNAKFKVASKCATEFEKVLNFSKKFNQESSNRLPKFPTSCPKFLQNESKSSEIQTEQNSNYKVTTSENIFIENAIHKNDKSDNFNTETIGFLLNSPEEFQECYENKIDNLIDFSKQVFNSMTKKVENKDFNSKARKTRVIEINTGDISAIEYELSKEQKNFLVFSGYVSTIDFLIENKYIKEILNKDDVDEMRQYIKWYLERSHCGNK